jgi:hypothetical protein
MPYHRGIPSHREWYRRNGNKYSLRMVKCEYAPYTAECLDNNNAKKIIEKRLKDRQNCP